MKESEITAYALGELRGEERAKFEAELAKSAALQEELAALSGLAEELEKLPPGAPAFTEEEREALRVRCLSELRAKSEARNVVPFPMWAGGWMGLGLAAAVLISLGVFFLWPEEEGVPLETVASVPASSDLSEIPQLPEVAEPAAMESEVELLAGLSQTEGPDRFAGEVGGFVEYGAPVVTSAPLLATAPAAPAPTRGEVQAQIAEFSRGWGAGSGRGTVVRAREAGLPSSGWAEADSVTGGTPWNTEQYNALTENPFLRVADHPLSTFSIDVDTASYANVRRFLQAGQLPPVGAVRTEEMINYFVYDYAKPEGEAPFAVDLEMSVSPWAADRRLVRIALASAEVPLENRPPSNLVFLIDVSGSMMPPDRLPLLREGLKAMVRNLGEEDRVAIVVYAGSSGLVLPSTPGKERQTILEALERLEAGGSTHGAAGIRQAYEVAREHFLPGGNNRVILATDGDFNVGVTNQSELKVLIEKERESGVFLTVLGVGRGNLNDATMKLLAQHGNGQYFYLDSPMEARRVLVEQFGSTLFTVAKDVKLQVEFNPSLVAGYRLVGYENRLLAKEDFNNDAKDAGEIGAGHRVTAFYEIILAGQEVPGGPEVDPLRYQTRLQLSPEGDTGELLTVKMRFKAPDGEESQLLSFALPAAEVPPLEEASEDFRFAAAVAAFAGKLRGSVGAEALSWEEIQAMARGALGADPGAHRAEFLTLVERAKALRAELTEEKEAQSE